MRLSSRCKINKNLGGDFYVSFGRFRQQPLPVPLRNRIVPTPLASTFFRNPKINRQLCAAPSFYDFSKAVHSWYYGVLPHKLQGAEPQCYIWLNRGKYPL